MKALKTASFPRRQKALRKRECNMERYLEEIRQYNMRLERLNREPWLMNNKCLQKLMHFKQSVKNISWCARDTLTLVLPEERSLECWSRRIEWPYRNAGHPRKDLLSTLQQLKQTSSYTLMATANERRRWNTVYLGVCTLPFKRLDGNPQFLQCPRTSWPVVSALGWSPSHSNLASLPIHRRRISPLLLACIAIGVHAMKTARRDFGKELYTRDRRPNIARYSQDESSWTSVVDRVFFFLCRDL